MPPSDPRCGGGRKFETSGFAVPAGSRLAALAAVSGVLLLPPSTSAQVPLETTPPLAAYSIDGIVGTNGWYREARAATSSSCTGR